MLKILIILIIYYVLIISTDSRSRIMSGKEVITDDRNNISHEIQIRCNKTDEESKNLTTFHNITLLELTGLQNNSDTSTILNINQTSSIGNKSLNGNENKTKEILHLPDGGTYEENLTPTLHRNPENSVNSNTDNHNNTNKIDVILQNNSINQTFEIEDKSLNGNENKIKEFLYAPVGSTYEKELTPAEYPNPENSVIGTTDDDANITNKTRPILENRTEESMALNINQMSVTEDKPLNGNENGRTYENELTLTLNPNSENTVIGSTDDNANNINKTRIILQHPTEKSIIRNMNRTSVIEDNSLNEDKNRRNYENELTPTLHLKPENNVNGSINNVNSTNKKVTIIGNRIGTNTIITLQGGGGPG